MATADGMLSQFRQPEYTGENRCMPCTVVNTIIAAVLGGGIAIGGSVLVGPVIGGAVGSAVFGAGLFAIYLRGYLVPGTPELTKRYLPPWVLSLFGKQPVLEEHEPIADADSAAIDPERALVRIGALEECADSDDLCLTPRFRQAWQEELDAIDDETSRDRLLELLAVDVGEVNYQEFGNAFRARIDGRVVGKWESEAAFLADLGAARVFDRHHPDWRELPVAARGQLLNGLRLFADTCPECGGTPSFGAETVESCCSTYEVAAVACDNCEARLFETPLDR